MESIIFYKLIKNTILFTEFDSILSSYNFATIFSIKQFERHMHMHTCTVHTYIPAGWPKLAWQLLWNIVKIQKARLSLNHLRNMRKQYLCTCVQHLFSWLFYRCPESEILPVRATCMKVSIMCCCNSWKVVGIRVTYIPFANETRM
jgi:hypothetical protein